MGQCRRAKATVEPHLRGEKKHWDVSVKLGGKKTGLDVTVRHPLAPSNVRVAAKGPKALLVDADQEKHDVYDRIATGAGCDFKAMSFTTFGGFSDEALGYIKSLITEGGRIKTVWQPRELVHGIYRTIAVAILRGNANVVEVNLDKAQGDGGRRGVL